MSDADAKSHQNQSPLPTPPDFPVTWKDRDDERILWQLDAMHFPEPVTPMMGWFGQVFSEGYKRASQASQRPTRIELRRINTYFYNGLVPMAPPEEMEGRVKRAEEKARLDMARLWEWWDAELLPEVKEHLAFWDAFDRGGATMPALLTHLEDTQARLTRLWEIHFLVAFPFILAPSMFEELYQDLFGKEKVLDAYRLLQGFGNKTVEGGHALWGLSRKALAAPQVGRALEENGAAAVLAALERSPEGRGFLDELRGYLEEYGRRSDVFAELGNPHWIENPATPIKNLQDFLSQPNRDLGAELKALAAERERLIAEARERLQGHPRPVVDQFEFLLKAAQAGTVIQENHNYWIDQQATYSVRRVLLEFGRRFAEAGVTELPDDVFYLTAEELRETAPALPQGDRRNLVVERKAEMDHFRAIRPPPALGTPPPGTPPDDPMSSAIGKFFGGPPEASKEPDVLLGTAASPGKTRGTARVVLSLAEAGKLQPGDILVAPTTMPAWTPFFASISALVAETGGVLCHGAIVAREYNIPAVVGAANATAVIEDGQTLEVDGDAGVVRIIRIDSQA